MAVLSRRNLLWAGLATTVAAGGMAANRGLAAGSFGPLTAGPAFQPWKDWRVGVYQGPLALVSAAVLAANPHNSQPWRFHVEPERVLLRADPTRALGPVDPFRREMHIGLGCALENMMVAARDRGQAATLTLLPGGSGDPDLVAALDLAPGTVPAAVDPHLLAIAARHTHRGAYDRAKPPAPAALAALASRVDDDQTTVLLFPADGERGRDFAAATVDATAQIVADEAMQRVNMSWFRQTRDDVARHRDGVSVATSGASGLAIRVAMALPELGPERFGRYWLEATRDVHCATAPLFGLIAVRVPHDRSQLLRAGRLWQRLHLEASLHDVAMQPLNQALEVVDRERQFSRPPAMADRLAALVGDPGWTAVFAFRAGYASTKARPSARLGVDEVVDPAAA